MPDNILMKLGAVKPVWDKRNVMLSQIVDAELLPPLPATFDVDVSLATIIPDSMDGNDTYGDCVIAARAKQTRRFECFEQGNCPDIPQKVITDEYFYETGGPDVGLDVLTSLKRWRREGWTIGGRVYRIYAFAAVNWLDHDEVKYAILLFKGIQITLALPKSAQQEGVWTATQDTPGSWGYHQVYAPRYVDVVGYDANGVIIRTWGKEQRVTWDWWDKYVCGAFIVIDAPDYWLPDSPIKIDVLTQLLLAAAHTAPDIESDPLPYPQPPIPPDPIPPIPPDPAPPKPDPPAPPVPPGCFPGSAIIKLVGGLNMNWIKNHKVLLLTVVVAIIAAITSDTTHSLVLASIAAPLLVILNLIKGELSGAQVAKLKARLTKANLPTN